MLHTWHTYLEKHLVLPFAAKVAESDFGPVHEGTRITVVAITVLDRTHGTIVAVKHKDRVHQLPLSDLEATQANPKAARG